ncbi:sensor histidine kinase [Galactobacter caseinivorans]|uniref:histidine kinase n=1 Tax=Galactobacter caseinivorans TaxID=2676123 RepID=A0A496PJ57_9MICC|nr:HAMP domain-containing sensor histidine kinase [Galactobacter caseinivorans]RKW70533.1 sensor histidine kinase [Galactobacter caseinivorans]
MSRWRPRRIVGAGLRRVGPLRLRLVLVTVVSVFLAISLCGILVHLLVSQAEDDRLRNMAREQLGQVQSIYAQTGVRSFGAKMNDRNVPEDLRESALAGNVATARIKLGNDSETVIAATPVTIDSETSVLSIELSAAASIEVLRQLDRTLIGAGIGSSVVVLVLAGFVSSGLTRRLAAASTAASALAEGVGQGADGRTVAQSIRTGRFPDEVDSLARAVDSMAERLRTKLEMEQRFTADLAHELRTPLTGLVMAASLLEDSRPAELVKERTERLRVLVEDLLEVSRFEAGAVEADLEPAGLERSVRSAVKRARQEGVPSAELVEVVPGDTDPPLIMVEQRRLDRIVSNLIKNAAAHGRPPLVIRVDGPLLIATDAGKGFPESILDAGPHRFQTRGGGWGLGLTIVRGQASVQGATFALSNAPDGGARITLRFREAPQELLNEVCPEALARSGGRKAEWNDGTHE